MLLRSQGIGLRSGTTWGDDRGLPDREGEAEGRRVAMGEEDGEGEAEEDGGIGG